MSVLGERVRDRLRRAVGDTRSERGPLPRADDGSEDVSSGLNNPAVVSVGWRNTTAAFAAAGLFFVVLTANLCFPTPQGPADNGDFLRITSDFSTGPEGYEYLPVGGGDASDGRYFTYYHRYWLLERSDQTDLRVPCSSSLLFLPGRFLDANAPPGYFDLTFNTFVLIVVLAVAVFGFFRLLPPAASLSLGVLASVVLADAGVAAYLNSFYQESGAYFFSVLLLCALGWWWSRGSWPALIALLGTAAFAMASKRPLAISVAVILLVVTGAAAARAGFAKRSLITVLLAAAVVGVTGLAVNRVSTPPFHSKVYCYSSIFDGMLLMIDEGDRVAFLRTLGLPDSWVRFTGVLPHGSATPLADVKIQAAMSGALHSRAVVNFVVHHPAALCRLLDRVIGMAGQYEVPGFGYRGPEYSPTSQDLGSLHWWTKVRASGIEAWTGYQLGAIFICVLFALRAKARAGEWLSALRWGAVAFYLGSWCQIAVVGLGDGCISVPKALYFANLSLDVVFLLALAAIAMVASPGVAALYGRSLLRAGRKAELGAPDRTRD